jgi:opacity protein-like surface antigen
MKKIMIALSTTLLGLSINVNAVEFQPSSNVSLEYSPITIQTDNGFKSESDIFTFGYTSYYTNNISTKFSLGMGKGSNTATVNGVNTGDNARVNYIGSADIRYEIPLTNSFSTYAIAGATYIDIETTENILNERRGDFGLKLGFGVSYAVSKNSAVYAEIKQDLYKEDFEAQSWGIGFKFAF